jgi:hypothetical protein
VYHATHLFLVVLFLVLFLVLVIIVIIILTVIIIVGIAILFEILSRLLFALHSPFSELFHHLKEFLPIVLEKVIRDGENVACEVES